MMPKSNLMLFIGELVFLSTRLILAIGGEVSLSALKESFRMGKSLRKLSAFSGTMFFSKTDHPVAIVFTGILCKK